MKAGAIILNHWDTMSGLIPAVNGEVMEKKRLMIFSLDLTLIREKISKKRGNQLLNKILK